jgi:hypothetical protein
MSRPINFANIILDPENTDEDEENRWGEVLYDNGEDVLASAAAYAALKVLETGWDGELVTCNEHGDPFAGQDRRFLLSSLDHTIDRLRDWRRAFSAAVTATDIEDRVQESVAEAFSSGSASPETLHEAAADLVRAQALRAGWNPQALADLTRLAFEFPADPADPALPEGEGAP